MKPWIAAAADLLCVLGFVAVGLQAHHEGDSLLQVAAPFLAALAVGWVVAAPLRAPQSLRAGFYIWLVTLVGGMLLRRVLGEGTALAFVIVATLVLAASMLGWRAFAAAVLSRRSAAQQ